MSPKQASSFLHRPILHRCMIWSHALLFFTITKVAFTCESSIFFQTDLHLWANSNIIQDRKERYHYKIKVHPSKTAGTEYPHRRKTCKRRIWVKQKKKKMDTRTDVRRDSGTLPIQMANMLKSQLTHPHTMHRSLTNKATKLNRNKWKGWIQKQM